MQPSNEHNSPDSFWQRLARATAWLEDAILVLLLALMISLACSQIILRNIWDVGLAWGDPLLRVMVLWTGLLGAIAATRDDNHISIDILYRFLPPAAKQICRMLTDLFTAAVCGIVAWYAGLLVILEKQDGSILFAKFPAWISELILPVAFSIMALRFFISFILRLVKQKPVASDGAS